MIFENVILERRNIYARDSSWGRKSLWSGYRKRRRSNIVAVVLIMKLLEFVGILETQHRRFSEPKKSLFIFNISVALQRRFSRSLSLSKSVKNSRVLSPPSQGSRDVLDVAINQSLRGCRFSSALRSFCAAHRAAQRSVFLQPSTFYDSRYCRFSATFSHFRLPSPFQFPVEISNFRRKTFFLFQGFTIFRYGNISTRKVCNFANPNFAFCFVFPLTSLSNIANEISSLRCFDCDSLLLHAQSFNGRFLCRFFKKSPWQERRACRVRY